VCSFSPGVGFVFQSQGPAQTKNLPGKNSLAVLEPSALIQNTPVACQYIFKKFFGGRNASAIRWRMKRRGEALGGARSCGAAQVGKVCGEK